MNTVSKQHTSTARLTAYGSMVGFTLPPSPTRIGKIAYLRCVFRIMLHHSFWLFASFTKSPGAIVDAGALGDGARSVNLCALA